MSAESKIDRFRRLPERPDPAAWQAGRDEGPLPQAIAEPVDVGDTGMRWVAPEVEASRRISDAIVRHRTSQD